MCHRVVVVFFLKMEVDPQMAVFIGTKMIGRWIFGVSDFQTNLSRDKCDEIGSRKCDADQLIEITLIERSSDRNEFDGVNKFHRGRLHRGRSCQSSV